MSETREPARWTKFEDADHGATPTFGISYKSDEGQHILCTGTYKWQADWLVKVLNQFCTREVPDLPCQAIEQVASLEQRNRKKDGP